MYQSRTTNCNNRRLRNRLSRSWSVRCVHATLNLTSVKTRAHWVTGFGLELGDFKRKNKRKCRAGTGWVGSQMQRDSDFCCDVSCNSNEPLAVQKVEPPEATSPEAQAVHGGKPSEPKECFGHFPGRACNQRGSGRLHCLSSVRM